MVAWARRYYQAEIQPAVAALTPGVALAGVIGCALLANKRYLADRSVIANPLERWQAAAAWLLATVVLVLVHAGSGRRAARTSAGLVLGLLMLAAGTAPDLTGGQWPPTWHTPTWRSPLRLEGFWMLAMAWLLVAPAAARAAGGRRRVGASVLLALLAGGLAAAVMAGSGPARPLLVDIHHDKLNWGLLTAMWLLALPLITSWGLSGGRFVDDGGGLGRIRFWLPWTVVLLAFMVALIVFVAGRQTGFREYYPMFRQDWPNYLPERDGWTFLIAYEATYGLYFLAWEFFFRGWMLFRLEPQFGPRAIVIQALPFVFMHIGKPPLEFHSALLAGLALGWLAWRGRSFWPCFVLHFGAALAMDLTALFGRLPG